MKEFKYDVIQLISGVRERACLWDKTLENYKDRVERRAAWEEIFRMLDERYDEMTAEEKRTTGELILNKWTNIRDTFVKSLKTKMGRPKRKYLLHSHLKFLTKVIPAYEGGLELVNEASNPYLKQEEPECETIVESTSSSKKSKHEDVDYDYTIPESSNNTHNTRKRSKKTEYKDEDFFVNTRELENNSGLNFVEVDEDYDARMMNEDEAFFASLLPTVVKYNEHERLEFRIQVLAVMKKIPYLFHNNKWTD